MASGHIGPTLPWLSRVRFFSKYGRVGFFSACPWIRRAALKTARDQHYLPPQKPYRLIYKNSVQIPCSKFLKLFPVKDNRTILLLEIFAYKSTNMHSHIYTHTRILLAFQHVVFRLFQLYTVGI